MLCGRSLYLCAISSLILSVRCEDRLRQPAKNHNVNKEDIHPMLYFSANDVKEMRNKAAGTHDKIAKIIQVAGRALAGRPEAYLPPISFNKFASRWNEVYGNNLCAFAMYSLLYPGDEVTMNHVKTFMDRMASYPDWYVASSHGVDQVPVGHSLTGFATAYDFLYPWLESSRRETYYKAIRKVSLHLYTLLEKGRGGWTRQYIHNHAPSNIVGLLLGALVVSTQEPKLASTWIDLAKTHVDIAMKILNHVIDGSMDEGVAYGSYTSRGITQYVYLAKRHLNTDHTRNPWLKEHFWFFYKTILPGFQRSVGIADSNHNWFFGPESQLVFLDNYVMQNGYGNWLADKIRRAKPKNHPLSPSGSQGWSTLHTEFIFYNASIKPQKPADYKLHIFSDWGVVTYGGGQDMRMGNTFLSFKSGSVNGEAAGEIMAKKYFPEVVKGWENFNPGHEHPDHNSFVFAPNGRYFITEALYGPKFSYLDNVILFAPSASSTCNQPWEGQIGECSKWLKYKEYKSGKRGEVVTASLSGDMVFMGGEGVDAYSKSLGLSSVFRGLLLLNPEVLIVVDSIKLLPGSKTKVASAIFHNMLHPFETYNHLGYKGAYVRYPEGSYTMFSMMKAEKGKRSSVTSLNKGVQPEGLREGPTNYINVTFQLDKEITNIVHVFSGPTYSVKSASVLSSGASGVLLSLTINRHTYRISIATSVRSIMRKSVPTEERSKLTGFGGYAAVSVGPKQHLFGMKKSKTEGRLQDISTLESDLFLRDEMLALSKTAHFELSWQKNQNINNLKNDFVRRGSVRSHHQSDWFTDQAPMLSFLFLGIGISSVFLLLVMSSNGVYVLRRKVKQASLSVMPWTLVVIGLIGINLVCIDSDGYNTCAIRRTTRSMDRDSSLLPNFVQPFVFVTSLPGSGSELLDRVFSENKEFLYLSVPAQNVSIPNERFDTNKPDLCSWSELQNEFNILTLGWFFSLKDRPFLHLNNAPNTEHISHLKQHMRGHRNTPVALSATSGFWNAKIPWVRSVLGEESLRPILVVRDPRSWIYSVLDDTNAQRRRKTLKSLSDSYDNLEKTCEAAGIVPPAYTTALKELKKSRTSELRIVEKLAVVWTISTAAAMYNDRLPGQQQQPLQIVRFEDIVSKPEQTAVEIFARLGVPLSIKPLNSLIKTIKSEYFTLPHVGALTPGLIDRWKSALTKTDIDQIEAITCSLMTLLDYECELSL